MTHASLDALPLASSGDRNDGDDDNAGNADDADVQRQPRLEHPLEPPTVQGKAGAVG